MKRRFWSLLLAAAMVLTFMPAAASAYSGTDYPNAVAEYKPVGGQHPGLVYDCGRIEDNFYHEFVQNGDSVIVDLKDKSTDSTKITFTYNGHVFVDPDGNELDIGVDEPYFDKDSVEVYAYQQTDVSDPHYKFYCYLTLKARLIPAKAISFEPSDIALDAEDIKGNDGVYHLGNRVKGAREWYRNGFYKEGDVLTVTADDGSTTRLTFAYDSLCFDTPHYEKQISQNIIEYGPDNVNLGNNTVTISYGGASTKINVNVKSSETPAPVDPSADAELFANAVFNGIPDASVPAVKGAKVKADRKSFTVSWNKAAKKKLKKFNKVEVQYSQIPSFPRTATAVKTVNKTKQSLKVKKLAKKSTYYVRVRGVKYAGGMKHVSSWSKVKKVKTK